MADPKDPKLVNTGVRVALVLGVCLVLLYLLLLFLCLSRCILVVFYVCNVAVVVVVALFGVVVMFFPLLSCRSRDVRADLF